MRKKIKAKAINNYLINVLNKHFNLNGRNRFNKISQECIKDVSIEPNKKLLTQTVREAIRDDYILTTNLRANQKAKENLNLMIKLDERSTDHVLDLTIKDVYEKYFGSLEFKYYLAKVQKTESQGYFSRFKAIALGNMNTDGFIKYYEINRANARRRN